MTDEYTLHERLAADTFHVVDLPVSALLLMNDCRYPWCILVPRIPDLRELHDVPAEQQTPLLDEINRVAAALQSQHGAHKMNVAALGNMVPQLHVHVIARQTDDPAWPGPVWGVGEVTPYAAAAAAAAVDTLRILLRGN